MSLTALYLIEVKGDNKIDDLLVKTKESAAKEIANESGVAYVMYAGSIITNHNVLEQDMSISPQLKLLKRTET